MGFGSESREEREPDRPFVSDIVESEDPVAAAAAVLKSECSGEAFRAVLAAAQRSAERGQTDQAEQLLHAFDEHFGDLPPAEQDGLESLTKVARQQLFFTDRINLRLS